MSQLINPLPQNYFSTNRTFEIYNLFALLVGGIIIKIAFAGNNPANSTIWGYGLSSIALFLLMILSLALANPRQLEEKFFSNFISYAMPSFLLFILISWVVIINVTYTDKINSGILPTEFNFYSFMSSIIMILQTGVLFMFYIDKLKIYRGLNSSLSVISSSKNSTITYLFTLVNMLLIGMMQIVLTFFATDG